MTPLERLLAKTAATEHGLIWTGAVNGDGYGVMHVRWEGRKKITALVHRYWYEANKGRSIMRGNDVHHTCHIRRCLTHLEEIDAIKNRGDIWRSNKARKFRVASERKIYKGVVVTSSAVRLVA